MILTAPWSEAGIAVSGPYLDIVFLSLIITKLPGPTQDQQKSYNTHHYNRPSQFVVDGC